MRTDGCTVPERCICRVDLTDLEAYNELLVLANGKFADMFT